MPTPARSRVTVLSHGLWQRQFGADRSVLGRNLTLDNISYTIVGVAAPDFKLFDTPAELWLPYLLDNKELAERGFRVLKVIARLKDGTTFDQASSEMQSIVAQLAAEYPDMNAKWGFKLLPLRDQITGDLRRPLWILLGAVGLVLLIACGNVAGILLMKAGTRHRELAIRTTLGASPARLLSQILSESVVLSLVSALLGVAIAWGGTRLLANAGPATIPQLRDLSMDWRVLAFSILLGVGTGLVFGLVPGISAMHADLNATLRASGRSGMSGVTWGRIRNTLVIVELMLAQVLLIGAGLLLRSLWTLEGVPMGFHSDHVISMKISLPETRYEGLRVGQFYQRLLEKISTLPAVEHAGVARDLPLSGSNPSLNFEIEGAAPLPSGQQPRARYRSANAGYFSALRIPVIRGRVFDRGDSEKTQPVAVINQSLARREWPDQDPIGRRIRSGFDGSPWCTIIGVVGDVKHAGLDAPNDAEIYYHFLQVPAALMPFIEGTMTLTIRTQGDPASVVSGVRSAVAEQDRELAVYNIRTVEELVSGSVEQPRFRTALLMLFAAAAMVLASIGLYGLLAYSVSQRTNELGVRSALGATVADVIRLIVGEGVALAITGVITGLIVALLMSHLVKKLLFGVTPLDLVSFAVTPLVLLLIALTACVLPALRAARVQPSDALRDQ